MLPLPIMLWTLYAIALLVLVYTLRHYFFTLNRLFGRQRHPYTDIEQGDWPSLTVFIPAHNEEAVIADSLNALLESDYPRDKIRLMPVNDRSRDRTRAIIDEISTRHPGRIAAFHRDTGKPGKAAALKDASALTDSEIIIIFDADYVPGPGLIRQLVAPFFDPEVGAVMGRVIPLNVDSNLLTRLLDLERAGGYQVDQQARMNLGLVPQFGGTVGGVRVAALREIGGWHDDVLTEDTDLTYRLLLSGWKTVYQNSSECYEEVPETWDVRMRQIMRWAKGHNQALFRHGVKLIQGGHGDGQRRGPAPRQPRPRERFDGFLLLGVYLMAPTLLLGWLLALALFYLNATPALNGIIGFLALACFSSLGNFAAFFEIAAAAHLDQSQQRLRLLPLNFFGFLISSVCIIRAVFDQILVDPLLNRGLRWDKTARYRCAGVGKLR